MKRCLLAIGALLGVSIGWASADTSGYLVITIDLSKLEKVKEKAKEGGGNGNAGGMTGMGGTR